MPKKFKFIEIQCGLPIPEDFIFWKPRPHDLRSPATRLDPHAMLNHGDGFQASTVPFEAGTFKRIVLNRSNVGHLDPVSRLIIEEKLLRHGFDTVNWSVGNGQSAIEDSANIAEPSTDDLNAHCAKNRLSKSEIIIPSREMIDAMFKAWSRPCNIDGLHGLQANHYELRLGAPQHEPCNLASESEESELFKLIAALTSKDRLSEAAYLALAKNAIAGLSKELLSQFHKSNCTHLIRACYANVSSDGKATINKMLSDKERYTVIRELDAQPSFQTSRDDDGDSSENPYFHMNSEPAGVWFRDREGKSYFLPTTEEGSLQKLLSRLVDLEQEEKDKLIEENLNNIPRHLRYKLLKHAGPHLRIDMLKKIDIVDIERFEDLLEIINAPIEYILLHLILKLNAKHFQDPANIASIVLNLPDSIGKRILKSLHKDGVINHTDYQNILKLHRLISDNDVSIGQKDNPTIPTIATLAVTTLYIGVLTIETMQQVLTYAKKGHFVGIRTIKIEDYDEQLSKKQRDHFLRLLENDKINLPGLETISLPRMNRSPFSRLFKRKEEATYTTHTIPTDSHPREITYYLEDKAEALSSVIKSDSKSKKKLYVRKNRSQKRKSILTIRTLILTLLLVAVASVLIIAGSLAGFYLFGLSPLVATAIAVASVALAILFITSFSIGVGGFTRLVKHLQNKKTNALTSDKNSIMSMQAEGEILNPMPNASDQVRISAMSSHVDDRGRLTEEDVTPYRLSDCIISQTVPTLTKEMIDAYKNDFHSERVHYYFSTEIKKAHTWQRLRSMSSQENINGIYSEPETEIEIARGSDGFFYVRAKNPCSISYVISTKPATANDDLFSAVPSDNPIKTVITDYKDSDKLEMSTTKKTKRPKRISDKA